MEILIEQDSQVSIETVNLEVPATPEKEFGVIPPDSDIVKFSDASSVDLLEDCVRVKFENGFTKLVSWEDFSSSISSAITLSNAKDSDLGRSFHLPENTFLFETGPSSLRFACYYPGCVRDVNFMGVVKKRIVPNIILYHTFGKGEKNDQWSHKSVIFTCTDLELSDVPRKFMFETSPKDRIFLLPFSNMYDSGAMCTGQNQLPKTFVKDDFRALQWYFDMIWASPFNFDLGLRGLDHGTSFYMDGSAGVPKWFDFLEKIATEEKPEFPYNRLKGWKKNSKLMSTVSSNLLTPVTAGNSAVDDDNDDDVDF